MELQLVPPLADDPWRAELGDTALIHRGLDVAVSLAPVVAHLRWMSWRNLSPGTIEQRRLTLARFARHQQVEPLDAQTAHIAAFRDRLTRAGQPLQPQSINAELAHLHGFYRWAILEGLRDDDPTVRIPRPKLPRGIPHPMPEHLMAQALRDADESRVRPWLLLAGFAGLRACEIAPLRGDDLWWHAEPPLIVIRRAKGGNEQAVPLSPVLAPELRSLPSRGWLFPYRDGKLGPVKPHTVSHLANDHLHRVGILNYTLHSLRHRFGTQVLRVSGGDLRQTQELMRHRSIASTVRYTQVDQTEGAGIVSALPAIAV